TGIGRSDRQVDDQMVGVEDVILEAALWRGREEFEWKQPGNPWMRIGVASHGHQILAIRSLTIESDTAGEFPPAADQPETGYDRLPRKAGIRSLRRPERIRQQYRECGRTEIRADFDREAGATCGGWARFRMPGTYNQTARHAGECAE